MLPSSGYFKNINCPFYISGLCERPYCHFRHAKKEIRSASNSATQNEEILQKIVSAALHRVLQHTKVSSTVTQPGTTDSDVDINKVNNIQEIPSKATYNPTPISELKKINNCDTENDDEVIQRKKHIPVPYTPRRPTGVSIKRPVETNISSKPFVYMPPAVKYTPGCSDTILLDPYMPQGSTESNEKYLPGSGIELQEYTPAETQVSSKRNYVPSDKSNNNKKIMEYKPIKVSTQSQPSSVTYQPTLKHLAPCFSSDEEEPDIKKIKLTDDLDGLDDLGAEFDILDEILNEEKCNDNSNVITCDVLCEEKESINKQSSMKDCDHTKKHGISDKIENKKSHNKVKLEKNSTNIDKKGKSLPNNKEVQESKSKKTDKKSHKSSSKDREKIQEKTSDKKHSKSKSSENRSRHFDHSSSRSKHSKKHSKSSSSSKGDSKSKNKSHKSAKKSKDLHKKYKEETYICDLSDNDNHRDDDNGQRDEELCDISESDEDTIALECKRIFEEYVPQEKSVQNVEDVNMSLLEDVPEKEYVPSKKRISRTAGKDIKILPKAPMKPNYKVNAAQAMSERLSKIREYHATKNTMESTNIDSIVSKSDISKNTFTTPSSVNSKIRIAHVPYASTLISAKKTINPILKEEQPSSSTSCTIIQTIKKGTQRVAHMPNEKFIDRPGVLEPLASKIAANIRSTYLNMMIDECLKIYLAPTDAYARAQHEELATSKKCSTVQIYKNSAVLTVSRLRKELQECNGVKKSGSDCPTLQKIPQTISGKTSNSGSWSIESKNRRVINNAHEFSGQKFYNNIQKWLLTEQQLQDNGFPRPHSSGEKGRAIIFAQNRQKPPKGLIRTCCRCKKDFMVDKKGFPAVKTECIYHPNNKYRVRGEAKYQCCSQDASSDGCCIAPCHVYEYIDYENLKGYVRTLPPESVMENYGVYSLDCEMCYTTHGLDLTRVTVINSACKVVYETLVKPLHPIMDYNTRYSGITEEQMADVKTTLLDVQATLLAMFNRKTILIGHSLESDFKALKLIHDTVIDTSVMFPHKMGHPYKRALRNLCSEHLKKIIQNSVDGHDSAEDAMVCMELVIYKLKEDLKTK